MLPACRNLVPAVLLMCLAGGKLQADKASSAIDDSAYDQAPELNLSRSGWYHESGSDTHIMLGKRFGLTFENRRISRHLSFTGALALATALAGRAPDMMGYDTRSITARVLTSLPVLLWPVIIGKRTLGNLRGTNYRIKQHPIHIADDDSLERRLSMQFEHSVLSQSIDIRSTLPSLAGLPQEGLSMSFPLARLAYTLFSLSSDRINIYWEGRSSPVEIKVWLPGSTQITITIPAWGELLTARMKSQPLPALLSFLQPAGLDMINGALICLANRSANIHSCPAGHLTLESMSSNQSLLRFKPDKVGGLALLKGKQAGNRYLLPLPPCDKPNQCSMAASWFVDGETPSSLSDSHRSLYLYTRPTGPSQISPNTPILPRPIMRRIPAWLTDILTLLPYAGIYYGADRLLLKGMDTVGVGPAQFTTGGSALGLGWFGTGDEHKNTYNQSLFVPQGKNIMEGIKEHFALGDKPISPAEKAVIDTLPGQIPQETQYSITTTKESTLQNSGNSCYRDATFVYLAHTLTDADLQGILEGSFISKGRSAFQLESTQVRESFVAFMDGLRAHASEAELRTLRSSFLKSAIQYSRLYANTGLQYFIHRKNQHLEQQDAFDFLNFIYQIISTDNNPATVYHPQNYDVFDVDGQVFSWARTEHHWEPALGLIFPDSADYQDLSISDINSLLEYNQAPEQMSEDNLTFVPRSVLQKNGIKIPPEQLVSVSGYRQKGVKLPALRSIRIQHPAPSKLSGLTIHARMYHMNEKTGAKIKIRGVTRNLLAGPKKRDLTFDVYDRRNRPHKVNMELDSIIMHSGRDFQKGHYITATINEEGRIFLHDDMKSHVQEIKPKVADTPPIDTLLNHAQNNNWDPYILHYKLNKSRSINKKLNP